MSSPKTREEKDNLRRRKWWAVSNATGKGQKIKNKVTADHGHKEVTDKPGAGQEAQGDRNQVSRK